MSTTDSKIHENVVTPHETHSDSEPTRIIVIAVDASKYSEFAFDWAINNLVRPKTDQIVLVNVRPIVEFPGIYLAANIDFSPEFDKIEAENKKHSHELLQSYASKLSSHKYNIRGIALCGDARDEIAFKVDELKASLLVVGSRGLGGIKKALLGSVSEYLVHHLNVPVIIPRLQAKE
ncbi:hypothetical protein HK100_008881 [Physocladia obscura]|uniref:UspA domain-containing protein n=1 Tax=Physocladia obscura TaxID=109957 RepID=A0AAD5XEG0_9FUNG|nr:hypothetical protein HK100_008881 [Physocladia obscura]